MQSVAHNQFLEVAPEIPGVGALVAGMREIGRINFHDIKVKLVDNYEGKRWTPMRANTAERWYRGFLVLKFKYPSTVLVPNRAIDHFWHMHILDTRKYARDCQRVFGRPLHHAFSSGNVCGKDIDPAHFAAFANMKRLFLAEFGDPLIAFGDDPEDTLTACTDCPVDDEHLLTNVPNHRDHDITRNLASSSAAV